MYTAKHIFVEHSRGTFQTDSGENRVYDNVVLSDGVMTAKFKNKTGQTKLDFQRGDEVEVEAELEFAKGDRIVPNLLVIR